MTKMMTPRKAEYEKYCEKVPEHNRLKYMGWMAVIARGGISYEDMYSYTMQKNKPYLLEYQEYVKLCTDCEPFIKHGYRFYFLRNWTMEQILERTRSDKYIWRPHMTALKPKRPKPTPKQKVFKLSLSEKIKRKRLELGHPIT